jgi:CPA2 family monovalent cation:H+ antiporter-2
MEHPVLTGAIVLLTACVAVLALFERFHLPALLVYLLVGVVIGPHGLFLLPHTTDLHFYAEFGVVLLLFTIAREFSLAHLWSLRRHVFGLGGAQILVTAALGGALAWLAGMTPAGAFVLGGALAMSSTAVVTRELTRRRELGRSHGRLAVAVLIFQDLAVVCRF